MLANGAKLGYKEKSGAGTVTDLPGLKEIPDIGIDPEKVENTCLTDKNKKYELGIGDLGDMKYKFKYSNADAKCPYRVLRAAQDAGTVYTYEQTMADGTKFTYDAQVSVKVTGGGVNGAIEGEATMAVQSDITVTDPA